MAEHEYENIKLAKVPRGSRPAIEQSVEMLLRGLRTKSKAAQNGYFTAAQFFALATEGSSYGRTSELGKGKAARAESHAVSSPEEDEEEPG